uniref:50S ribosomal protein L9, chloroplastic n=1 Tax=Erythrotrichia carnea TaxID=35151 RepID=A0A1C9CEK4_9RHOD|nr:ribosomal protein L9 [Erythrotrichia carnea]AOM66797.1 ribosomal protein L9 [Erythrotrichia carnea]
MTQKHISVLLLKDVEKLGNIGTINNVALGYARNFLIPQGLACVTTPGIQRAVQKDLLRKKEIEAENINQAQKLAVIIEGIQTFTIKKKVGKDDLIFGSVTNQEIANSLENTLQKSIDKKNIKVPTIKKVGVYEIDIKLHNSVNAKINLQVLGEE